jgi:hypothetical protein
MSDPITIAGIVVSIITAIGVIIAKFRLCKSKCCCCDSECLSKTDETDENEKRDNRSFIARTLTRKKRTKEPRGLQPSERVQIQDDIV